MKCFKRKFENIEFLLFFHLDLRVFDAFLAKRLIVDTELSLTVLLRFPRFLRRRTRDRVEETVFVILGHLSRHLLFRQMGVKHLEVERLGLTRRDWLKIKLVF